MKHKIPSGYIRLRPRQHVKSGDIVFRGTFGSDDWIGAMPVNIGPREQVGNREMARPRNAEKKTKTKRNL